MGKGKKLVESIQYAEGGCRPDGPEKPSSHREPLTRPRNFSKREFVRTVACYRYADPLGLKTRAAIKGGYQSQVVPNAAG
jgi:hypothetical protein